MDSSKLSPKILAEGPSWGRNRTGRFCVTWAGKRPFARSGQLRLPPVLTVTLRQLEQEGLVSRTAYPANPPHVEYALTDLGRSLGEPIQHLGIWVLKNQGALAAARERFDQQQKAR